MHVIPHLDPLHLPLQQSPEAEQEAPNKPQVEGGSLESGGGFVGSGSPLQPPTHFFFPLFPLHLLLQHSLSAVHDSPFKFN